MLIIKESTIIGLEFYVADPNVRYKCIGYGQDPRSAANYVVGALWDQASNRSKISTHLFKEITLIGECK